MNSKLGCSFGVSREAKETTSKCAHAKKGGILHLAIAGKSTDFTFLTRIRGPTEKLVSDFLARHNSETECICELLQGDTRLTLTRCHIITRK